MRSWMRWLALRAIALVPRLQDRRRPAGGNGEKLGDHGFQARAPSCPAKRRDRCRPQPVRFAACADERETGAHHSLEARGEDETQLAALRGVHCAHPPRLTGSP